MVRRPRTGCGRANSSKNRSRKTHGFTLLEILITIALVLLVMVLVGSTLVGTASSATMARMRAEQEAELLRIVSTMRRQLITIAESSAARTSVLGEVGREPRSDWLDMVTSSLIFRRGVGHAEWRIIRTPGEEPYLGYRETPWVGGENLHNHPWIPYSRLITGMQVRFWSNPQYVEGWHRETVPERVQVVLYYIDDGEQASFMFEAIPGIAGSEAGTPGGGASGSPSPSTTPSASPSSNAGGATAPSAASTASPAAGAGGRPPP